VQQIKSYCEKICFRTFKLKVFTAAKVMIKKSVNSQLIGETCNKEINSMVLCQMDGLIHLNGFMPNGLTDY